MLFQGVEIDLTPEQVTNMTGPVLRAEIAKAWQQSEAIATRHGGVVLPEHADDYAQTKKLLATVDCLEDRSSVVDEAEAVARRRQAALKAARTPAEPHTHPNAGDDRSAFSVKAFERQFVESDAYKGLLESGLLHSPSNRVDLNVKLDGSLLKMLLGKALVWSGSGVGGPLIRADRVPGVDALYGDTNLLDLIPTGTTTSNAIEYYEQNVNTNNAAWVAEASATSGTSGTKPEGALGWILRTVPVGTLAEWIPVTNNMLADVPGIESTIRGQLLLHLQRKLQTDVLSGDGTAPNIRGILNWPGIQTLAAGTSVLDGIFNAMVAVQVTGLGNPTASVFNPVDFAAIRLARENGASGQYLMGPPSAAGPATLWGRPVVLSTSVPIDTALVADFTSMMLFDREQATIRVGLANDDFIRNIQRLLAELRAALAVFRPLQVVKVTGV